MLKLLKNTIYSSLFDICKENYAIIAVVTQFGYEKRKLVGVKFVERGPQKPLFDRNGIDCGIISDEGKNLLQGGNL